MNMEMNLTNKEEEKVLERNTSEDMQRAYRKFYDEMRNYLWDMETLEKLADLEVVVFDRFIDKEQLEKSIKDIEFAIRSQMNEEDSEDLKNAFEKMKETSEIEYDPWAPLPAIPMPGQNPDTEVRHNEDQEEHKRVRRVSSNP